MMMRILAALLTLCSPSLLAQDYLVTTKMDTIMGKLSISSYPTMDKVLVSQPQKKKVEYPCPYIYSIFLDSAFYQTVRVPEAYRIMRIGKTGPVSLCYARQSAGSPFDIPYLVKRTGESMQITAIRFRKSITTFLNDCPRVGDIIEKEQLGRKDLDRIIDEYNRCIYQQTPNSFAVTESKALSALSKMNQRFQKDATVPTDAVDILKDIYGKVKDGKQVPNYLLDGLRNSLSGRADYQEDLEALLKLLKE
jgi:hypothetical protein